MLQLSAALLRILKVRVSRIPCESIRPIPLVSPLSDLDGLNTLRNKRETSGQIVYSVDRAFNEQRVTTASRLVLAVTAVVSIAGHELRRSRP
jgi:hypothetical protein